MKHYSSNRKDGPFVNVNCGAIPESLIDSELLGHEKGAFTGALSQMRGRFERADKGTIFLDEIGELPLHAQVRLLRVLQNKEIERIGGVETIHLDIRIIAATNRNLDELISNHIKSVIERTNGKVHGPGGAAEILGVNPSSLRGKMRKYGIKHGRSFER